MQASNAWAMGNLGLSNSLQGDVKHDSYDDEDLGRGDNPGSWVDRFKGRLTRWSLEIGAFLAWANHWPRGH